MLGARAASRQKRNSLTSTWDTTQAGSANDSIDLDSVGPFISDGAYNCKVYWGDGTSDIITAYNQAETLHQYPSTGIYEIRMGGDITGWRFDSAGDKAKIINLSSWGPLVIITNRSFRNVDNMSLTSKNQLTVGSNSLFEMFDSCDLLGSDGDQSYWDTSSVTSMEEIFSNTTNFNQPLVGWDTSNVSNMGNAFLGQSNVNSPFNQDLGSWDVSNVTNMSSMFLYRNNFNNGDSPSISGWNTGKVTNMSNMFYDTAFNQPIGTWDVSGVTTMAAMFYSRRFNRPSVFDQDIGNWDVSSVNTMNSMFGGFNLTNANVFNNGGSDSISGWDTSNVTNMADMFSYNIAFNQPINSWNVGKVTSMTDMFQVARAFNQDLNNWDTSKVTSMDRMFESDFSNTGSFNGNISDWNVTGVTSMENMFIYADKFNNNGQTGINNWRPSSCTTMLNMFYDAIAFNQPIGDWDVSNVTNMSAMFYNRRYNQPSIFDQDIGAWNVGKVQNFSNMFGNFSSIRKVFNNGGSDSIRNWNTASATNISNMFDGCTGLDQPLDGWVVTGVTSATNFLNNGTLSTTNYDLTLSGWAQQSGDLQAGVSIDFGTSQYSIATGEQYKEILSGAGWTIVDGGSV